MTTQTLTLVDFLIARYSEQAADAESSHEHPWLVGHTMACDWWGDMPGHCSCKASERRAAEADTGMRLMALHGRPFQYNSNVPEACETCVNGDDIHDPDALFPCATLRLLAMPYADHPDFNPDWRP